MSCTSLLAECSPLLEAYLSFVQQIPSSTPGADDCHQAADTRRIAASVPLSSDYNYTRHVCLVVCLVRICLPGQVTSCEGALLLWEHLVAFCGCTWLLFDTSLGRGRPFSGSW